jgi:WD40 repeat protein
MQTLTGHKGKVRALAFAPGSNHLASAAGHGSSISLWDLARGKRTYLSGLTGKLQQVMFSRTGDRLVVRDDDANVFIWNMQADGRPIIARHKAYRVTLVGPQQALALMVMAKSPELQIHDPAGARSLSLPWHPIAVNNLAATPDGTVLAAALHSYELRPQRSVVFYRNGPTLEQAESLPLGAIPYAAAFSPDGAILAVATTKSIQRFATATATPLPALKEHTRMVTGLGYLPDGRLLSCSADGTVRTWTGEKCVDVKDWQLGELTALALAPDSMRAAVGCDSGTLFLWDVD